MNKFLLFLLLISATTINAQVTINPVPDQCVGNPSIQLIGNPSGGVWSGSGVDVNGVFTPPAAGAIMIAYTYNMQNAVKVITVYPSPEIALANFTI